MEGRVLGSYQLQAPLGEGAGGVVYRALDLETGTLVAVKTIQTPRSARLAALRREVQALARLRHPGIVSILAEGVSEGLPWYAMDLIEGRPLSEFVGPEVCTPLATRLTLLRQVCLTLAWLHGEGGVHRDLKPTNILVRSDGWPVLVDFGLSLHSDRTSREVLDISENLVGTATYLSPEQIRSETVDARADLYALGCMLFELIAGHPPFSGQTAREVLSAHVSQTPRRLSTLLPELNPALCRLVHQLLEKDPRARPGHASAVARQLLECGAEALTWEQTLPSPRPYLYRPLLSGRQTLMQALQRRLEKAQQSEGDLVLLVGESGCGKTRLLLEMAQEAGRLGFRTLSGGSEARLPSPQTAQGQIVHERARGGGPLSVWQQPLAGLADACRQGGVALTARILGTHASRLAAYVPAFQHLPGLDHLPPPESLPPAEQSVALFHALLEVLTAFSLTRPLFIALDDLQWADELSLRFLQFLAASPALGELPLLVVGSQRSEEADASFQSLVQVPGVARVEVPRLASHSVQAMIQDMLAMSDPPEHFARFVCRASEGAPFFVAEYLRMTMEEGLLFQDAAGRWQVHEDVELVTRYQSLPLPETLKTLALRRLRQLPPDALELVKAASVLGREMSKSLVRQLVTQARPEMESPSAISPQESWAADPQAPQTEAEHPRLTSAFQVLYRAQILEETASGLRFSHDLLRETAYRLLTPLEKRTWHRLAAQRLSADTDGDIPSPALLGRHWLEAGERENARGPLLIAARQASRLGSLMEAEALYQLLLDETPGSPVEVLETKVELALNVLLLRGKVQAARALFESGREEAVRLQAPAQEGACLLGLAEVSQLVGQLEPIAALCEQALAIFRAVGDRSAQVKALHRLAIARFNAGDRAVALAQREEGLALARACGDRYQEAVMLMTLGGHYSREGQWFVGQPLIEQSLKLREALGDLPGAGHTLRTVAGFRLYAGALADAISLTRLAQQRLEAAGALRRLPYVLYNLSFLETTFGQLDSRGLERFYRQVRAIERQLDDPRGQVVLRLTRLTLLHFEGKFEEVVAQGPAVLEQLLASGEREVEVQWYLKQAQAHQGLRQTDAAKAAARWVIEKGDARIDYTWISDAYRLLAELAREAGDLEAAEVYLTQAESAMAPFPQSHWMTWCAVERCWIALLRGEPVAQTLTTLETFGREQQVGADSLLGRALRALQVGALPGTGGI